MKRLTFILSVALIFTKISFAQSGHDHPSVHGMLLAGSSKTYLSHLPMFHSPHDYQVIFEVELDPETQVIYHSSLNSADETVYTLVPQVFVLPEMVKSPKPFTAKIYKGHFERGGNVLVDKVTVQIKKVIYFKKFNPLESKPKFGTYLLFGNEEEQFLAHLITKKPDFDQIMKIEVIPEAVDSLKKDGFIQVVFKSVLNSKPINSNDTLEAEGIASPLTLPIKIDSILYLEKGDLSH